MNTWDIKVLYLGKIKMPFSTMLSFHYQFGAPKVTEDFTISGPYLGFLLQCKGRNIVVDTGISEKFFVDGKAWAGLPAEGGKSYVLKALSKEGLRPEDIEMVVYTHLHNDHAGNCGLFTNAEIIFQKDEWQNLLDPLPLQKVRRDYDPDLIDELRALKCIKVEGDIELTDGVKLYKTQGHTIGSQSIGVNTSKGVVVLVGDLLTSHISAFPHLKEITDMEGRKHNLPPAPEAFKQGIPGALTCDFYSFYAGLDKIKMIASRYEPGFIIPGHETSLVLTGI
jgi:N-acyl homoserine lactone hydrolase